MSSEVLYYKGIRRFANPILEGYPGPVHFADNHFADNHFADAVLPTDCFADRYFLPTGYFLPTVTI